MNNVIRKHQMDNSNETPKNAMAGVLGFSLGLLIGGLSGTVATLLLAPRAGRKTRARIQHQYQELRNRVVEGAEDAEEEVIEKAQEVAHNVRDTVGDLQKRGKALINER